MVYVEWRFLLAVFILFSCGKAQKKSSGAELITDKDRQVSLFDSLTAVGDSSFFTKHLTDSMAVLILPVQASCPSCRKKVINALVKHLDEIPDGHYAVISANGGRKIISSYFKEEGHELPVLTKFIYYDTINQASKYALYDEKPTIYYSFNKRVYKKVSIVPSTVRYDLKEFFSEL